MYCKKQRLKGNRSAKILVSASFFDLQLGCPRNKQKIILVCFVKPKTKHFSLFRCFKPVSKQPKQTDLFRIKPKQTETTLNFLKNTKIYSLLNCLGGSSVSKQTEKNEKNEKSEKNRKNPKFLARFGIWRSFAKNLNLCVQTEKKE